LKDDDDDDDDKSENSQLKRKREMNKKQRGLCRFSYINERLVHRTSEPEVLFHAFNS